MKGAAWFQQWVRSFSPKGPRTIQDEIEAALWRLEAQWKLLPASDDVQRAIEECRAMMSSTPGDVTEET